MIDVWIAPKDINYSVPQLVYFLLPSLYEFREGFYPNEPDEYRTFVGGAWVNKKASTYEGGNSGASDIAPFITVSETVAELESRLSQIHTTLPGKVDGSVGVSGEALIMCYTDGIDEYTLADRLNVDAQSLIIELSKMLQYMSGYKRKRIDYEQWRREKRGKRVERIIDRLLNSLSAGRTR